MGRPLYGDVFGVDLQDVGTAMDEEEIDKSLWGKLESEEEEEEEENFSCGGSTGWRRVAYLNMSDPSQQCPSVWQEITTPHRTCGRRSTGVGVCVHADIMETLVYLICIAVASFAVLAQPAVDQGANTTLIPVIYPGQVLQGDGSQTCHSEEQRERVRNEVDNATLRLLQESVVPLLRTQLPAKPSTEHPCGGSGWRRVAYLNMSDPSQQCPSAWREITTPHRVCGRRSTGASCEGVTYSTGSEQYDQVHGRIILQIQLVN